MKKTILIAGYTKMANIRKIRNYFGSEEVSIVCAYTREPRTESKQKYLTLFDATYDLTNENDVKKLKEGKESISAITCTQERDMVVYIKSQVICNIITEEQADKYEILINKKTFKEEISKKYPELVPEVRLVDDALLGELDTLTYPQVIKPSGLAGSIMVRVVNSAEEFKKYYDEFSPQMKKIAEENYDKKIDVITESFTNGPQYSVNVYINGTGEVTFCPIVRVITPQELGISDTYSVFQYNTDEINGSELESLKTAVRHIVEHFDIKSTSAHFDSVLHNGQWKFFEVGLRIGGNRQSLFDLSHGIDHLRNDVMNRLGEEVNIPEQKKTACVVQKAAETHGNLKSISYTRSVTTEKPALIRENKMAKLGVDVMPLSLGGATLTRHIVFGKDYDKVIDTSKKLFEDIKFDIE